jgi:hypothetical protein
MGWERNLQRWIQHLASRVLAGCNGLDYASRERPSRRIRVGRVRRRPGGHFSL